MLSAANRSVIANTNKYVIYEFWRCMLDDPGRVASIASFLDKSIMGTTNDIAIAAQERWAEYKDPYVRAALFFLLNRYSENGQVSSGGIDTDRLNPIVIHRLKNFKAKNLYLNFNKQENFLVSEKSSLKIDYNMISAGKFSYNFFEEGKSRGYENTQVEHKPIRQFLKATDDKTFLLYEFHPALKKFYSDFEIVHLDKRGNPTSDKEQTTGTIIANFRIS